MQSSKLFIAAVAAVSVVGAATIAYAQTNSTGTVQNQPAMPQAQMANQPMNANPNSTTQRAADGTTMGTGSTGTAGTMGTTSTDSMNRNSTAGTAGTTSGTTDMPDSGTRSSTATRPMTTERMARADRN